MGDRPRPIQERASDRQVLRQLATWDVRVTAGRIRRSRRRSCESSIPLTFDSSGTAGNEGAAATSRRLRLADLDKVRRTPTALPAASISRTWRRRQRICPVRRHQVLTARPGGDRWRASPGQTRSHHLGIARCQARGAKTPGDAPGEQTMSMVSATRCLPTRPNHLSPDAMTPADRGDHCRRRAIRQLAIHRTIGHQNPNHGHSKNRKPRTKDHRRAANVETDRQCADQRPDLSRLRLPAYRRRITFHSQIPTPGTKNQEPRTKNQELRTKNDGGRRAQPLSPDRPPTSNPTRRWSPPRNMNQEPWPHDDVRRQPTHLTT